MIGSGILGQYFRSGSGFSGNRITATGGTIITDENRRIHIITANDTFEITELLAPVTINYLMVAGGGGGGNGYGGLGGGGGGAGGVISGSFSAAVGTWPIVIGGGGNGAAAGAADTNGSNGQNTTFNSLTAIGGGGGNSYDNPTSGSGGSAGGAAWNGVSGSATSGQGNVGGVKVSGANGGGGGGSDAAGEDGTTAGGGNGGDGILSTIAGISAYYAGGGGGAIYDGASLGLGGAGGGGRGAYGPSHDGVDGTANTGGGGGGGYRNDGNGGDGGSGIAIISYEFMDSCYANLNDVDLTSYLVETNTIGYSTFQSNNQKVVENANGIFLAYGRSANAAYTTQTWRLSKSLDGGQTFTSLYNDDSAYSAPCMETDSAGNLYLIAPFGITDAKFYKFLSSDYTTPSVTTTLTGLSQEKYSMALDEANDRIYFVSRSNKFVALDLDGVVVTSPYTLTQAGPYGNAEYPNLQLDDDGNLYCAWTTAYNGSDYWNISWMVSRDLGLTWEKADGTPITLPVMVDSTGPCDQITRYLDLGKTTFLSSFIFANERLHALYYLKDGSDYQQVYVRIHPTTGAVEIRTIQPLVCDPDVAGLDGFFVRNTYGTFASPDDLRVITTTGNRYIVSGISEDNGVTWKRNKVLDMNPDTGWRVYSCGGFRQLVDGTTAYGAFTLQDLDFGSPATGSGETYFIKMEI